MNKNVKLKDGTEILIRQLKKKDSSQLTVFFNSLPIEDRKYLRVDVTDKETVKKIIKSSKLGESLRIIARIEDKIVASGLLELGKKTWKKHSAEIRLLVSKDYRRKGLSIFLARELYSLAIKEEVEDIFAQIMKPQVTAIKTFKRLGFKQDAKVLDYVTDLEGIKQDLIIMRCNVNEMWKELEGYLEESDWQRTR